MNIKDWLIDSQLNGDDGTGHCDYEETICDFCGQSYEYESENNNDI